MIEASRARTTPFDASLAKSLEGLRPLVHACHARMGSPLSEVDVEEVLQETSLSAWRRRASFRHESDIDTWLYAIARNTILMQLRRSRRVTYTATETLEEASMMTEPGPGPGTEADTGIARVINIGLSAIGTTAGVICRARAVDGLSFVEISNQIDRSVASVKARYYRSLPELRRSLRSLWHGPTGS